ncbi:MAG: TlpA family protein disulfide reductase [Gemmataceae bacterium]
MGVRGIVISGFLFVSCAGSLNAADDVPPKTPWKKPAKPTLPDGTPSQQIEALIRQHDALWTAYQKRMEACDNNLEEKILNKQSPNTEPYADLILKIVQANPKDPIGADALVWVVRHGRPPRGTDDPSPSAKALAIIQREHLTHPSIGLLCSGLQMFAPSPEAEAVCRTVMENHPMPEVRAVAMFSLSRQLRERAGMAQTMQHSDGNFRKKIVTDFGEAAAEELATASPHALRKEADDLLEKIIATPPYAASLSPERNSPLTYGQIASQMLFRMRNLVPGKHAPELVGIDLDGQPIKLSEFKGRVVVINFWATWCGPCMGQVAAERDLAKEMEGRPFALLGINCDGDRVEAKKVVQEERMTWRSIWDGAPGEGAIQRQWAIDAIPQGFVIDHRGVIVQPFFDPKKSKRLIADLVAEAERMAK